MKERSRKHEEYAGLPEGQIRQAIGLRGRISAMPLGSVAGIFAPAAPSDTMRRSAEQFYQPVDWDKWHYGQTLHGFSMMGRFPFEVGDWIDFSAFGGDLARRVRILSIHQVIGNSLTEVDLELLGYRYDEWKIEGLTTRRGWLMKVRVEREIQGSHSSGSPVVIHDDGNVETIPPADSIDD